MKKMPCIGRSAFSNSYEASVHKRKLKCLLNSWKILGLDFPYLHCATYAESIKVPTHLNDYAMLALPTSSFREHYSQTDLALL